MPTIMKVRQQGGARVVTLPGALLERIGADAGTALALDVKDGAIVAVPVSNEARTPHRRYTMAELLVGAEHLPEIYSIDPNPVAGREMRDRHYWIVLTPDAVNAHGVAVAVAISTVAIGARAAGLTVQVSGDGVTGVAICTHLRSFDLPARMANGTARLAGIATRVASLIDPAPKP